MILPYARRPKKEDSRGIAQAEDEGAACRFYDISAFISDAYSEAKREELYFEQQFPEGSEARKMFGHGTAF